MRSLAPAFNRATIQPTGFSTFWLLVFAIAIDDDRQRREKEHRRQAGQRRRWQQKPKPPAPRPCFG